MFDGIGGNGEVKNLQLVDVDYDVRQNGVAGGIAWDSFGTITACSVTGTIAAASGSVGGIAAVNFGTITATKVNDGDSWQPAVDGMNAALTGNDYQWALGTDGLPVLQKKQ